MSTPSVLRQAWERHAWFDGGNGLRSSCCCWGFTCFPLVLHRERTDAQAGASLQASYHGRQCHLTPRASDEPAPASPHRRTASAPLRLSLPIPRLGSRNRRGWRNCPRPKPPANPHIPWEETARLRFRCPPHGSALGSALAASPLTFFRVSRTGDKCLLS